MLHTEPHQIGRQAPELAEYVPALDPFLEPASLAPAEETANGSAPSAADEILDRAEEYVLRPWSNGREPAPIVAAEGSTVTDADGRQLLDFTAGCFVNQVGHCHPRVVRAASEQMTRITQMSGRHTTPPMVDLAERLVKITPRPLKKAFFATGGSEANEFALKMARQHTGQSGVAVLENAYHGLTLGPLAACGSEKYRSTAGLPLGDHTYRIATPYCYRCPYQDRCALQCLDKAEEALDRRRDTAAILAEPIQSVGGVIPPKAWWERLDEMRRRRGLLLILDEIQTGLGRTGKLFAAEHYGLEPDVMTLGKGLSGGVGSLSAVLVSDEVAATFRSGTAPTSAGNPVSAAAGAALVDTLVEEGWVEHGAAMGAHLRASLGEIDHPWIGDVRFLGLMGGVELVSDRGTREVLPKDHVAAVAAGLRDEGMLLTVSGMYGNVLRIQPPLVITTAEIDALAGALKRVLATVKARR